MDDKKQSLVVVPCWCTITTLISSGFMSIAKIAIDAMDNEHSKIGFCSVGEVF